MVIYLRNIISVYVLLYANESEFSICHVVNENCYLKVWKSDLFLIQNVNLRMRESDIEKILTT